MSNVRNFGAAGDGQTDDTEAVVHALKDGDGVLEFPRGDYLIKRTIAVELEKTGRVAVHGSGGTAKLLMAGPGPAFHVLGTHDKSADPAGFAPSVWQKQRLPTFQNLEIEGRHPEAHGVLLEGTMQATFEGVLIRNVVHAIRLHRRARNLLISHCHIFDNSGVGVFLDRVNLHQTIITGSHISYCRQAGIKIVGSEIRNLQITGNDIEYNYAADREDCADILIDSSADGATVREGTIASNTIQARYSKGGANIRVIGRNPKLNHKAGMWTIAGNLVGSQDVNVHLVACRAVVVTGNVIYSGHGRNLLLEDCRNIVIGANSLDHNPDYGEKELCTGATISRCQDVVLSGLAIQDAQAGEHTVAGAVPIRRQGLVEILSSRRVSVAGCQVLDGYPHGIFIESSSDVAVTGTTILETRPQKMTKSPIFWSGPGTGNLIGHCRLSPGTDGGLSLAAEANVTIHGNLVGETTG